MSVLSILLSLLILNLTITTCLQLLIAALLHQNGDEKNAWQSIRDSAFNIVLLYITIQVLLLI